MKQVMVVLPTYNEIENLPVMVDALLALNIPNFRILIVDDNSPDGTGEMADTLVQRYTGIVHVLHRKSKDGLGAAYRQGFKKALSMGADYIIQMDCDFSHQPRYIPPMIEAAADYDLVLGSRYVQGGGVDESWGWSRKLLSWFANRIYTRTLLNIPINDATGGFRLWRKETLVGIDLDQVRSNGYIFQVEIAYISHRMGFSVKEIPIYFPDRERGYSKMGMRIAVEAALRVWQVLFRYHNLTPDMRRTQAYSEGT